jgi:uncharacterized protein
VDIRPKLKIIYRKFISLKGDPKPIAMGMAMGVFIGVTPTIPFHTALIVLLGIVFRQNITSAYLGSWLISNPLTIPLFYFAELKLGQFLLGYGPLNFVIADYCVWNIAEMGRQILVPLLTGGVIIAGLIAVPAYFITHRLVTFLRRRHRHEI